jgi:shikimate dehydrogenase
VVALADAGAGRIALFDIDPQRAAHVVRELGPLLPSCDVSVQSDPGAWDHDILVNATPVGMSPHDPAPILLGSLRHRPAVVDIAPSVTPTALMRAAAEAGCPVAGGQAMIDAQLPQLVRFLTETR